MPLAFAILVVLVFAVALVPNNAAQAAVSVLAATVIAGQSLLAYTVRTSKAVWLNSALTVVATAITVFLCVSTSPELLPYPFGIRVAFLGWYFGVGAVFAHVALVPSVLKDAKVRKVVVGSLVGVVALGSIGWGFAQAEKLALGLDTTVAFYEAEGDERVPANDAIVVTYQCDDETSIRFVGQHPNQVARTPTYCADERVLWIIPEGTELSSGRVAEQTIADSVHLLNTTNYFFTLRTVVSFGLLAPPRALGEFLIEEIGSTART
jgi:hypothetical protein